jgi:hypothetical protein
MRYCDVCGHAEGDKHDLLVRTKVVDAHPFRPSTGRSYAKPAAKQTPPKKKAPAPAKVGHGFNAGMTAATGGLWAPMWIASALTTKKRRHKQMLEAQYEIVEALRQAQEKG